MLSEKEGIQAIVALQKMAGIEETKKNAKKNWNSFNNIDKKQTEWAYKMLCDNSAKLN